MWSEFRAVKIIVWRMLSRLRKEGWPQDLLDMLYLEDEDLRFAKETGEHLDENEKIIHRDANGAILKAGDSVVLIKDLKVKGSSMVAKQGTAVRRISLDRENPEVYRRQSGANTNCDNHRICEEIINVLVFYYRKKPSKYLFAGSSIS